MCKVAPGARARGWRKRGAEFVKMIEMGGAAREFLQMDVEVAVGLVDSFPDTLVGAAALLDDVHDCDEVVDVQRCWLDIEWDTRCDQMLDELCRSVAIEAFLGAAVVDSENAGRLLLGEYAVGRMLVARLCDIEALRSKLWVGPQTGLDASRVASNNGIDQDIQGSHSHTHIGPGGREK